MDARGRMELLAPQPDRGEQHDQRIERVLAAPRVRRGVRLQAREDDLDVLRRERMALDVVAVARVVEQRRVEALEQPVVDHDLLAAPPLLGRRAEEDDLARELVGERRERDRGPDPGGRHRVVAAAVTETRAARRTRRGSRSAGRRRPDHGEWRGPRSPGCRPDARRRTRGAPGSPRPRPRRGSPRRPARGRRGSGARDRRSRRGRPRRLRRRAPWRPRTGRPVGWRSTGALGLLACLGRPPDDERTIPGGSRPSALGGERRLGDQRRGRS